MTATTDDRARRVVAAVAAAVGSELPGPGPGSRTLVDLYLRVRDRIEPLDAQTCCEEGVAEDVALTVYLAWQAEENAPGPDVLVPLKACIEVALRQPTEGDG